MAPSSPPSMNSYGRRRWSLIRTPRATHDRPPRAVRHLPVSCGTVHTCPPGAVRFIPAHLVNVRLSDFILARFARFIALYYWNTTEKQGACSRRRKVGRAAVNPATIPPWGAGSMDRHTSSPAPKVPKRAGEFTAHPAAPLPCRVRASGAHRTTPHVSEIHILSSWALGGVHGGDIRYI